MLKTNTYDLLVVGAGIFGITTALEMQRRGYHVAVLDPGPLPHPLAASTDISKIIRMEYGADESYMSLAEEAYHGWLQWNQEFADTLFHDTGIAMLTRKPMAPDELEYESYHLLLKRGHTPEHLTAESIVQRFPALRPGVFVDGFFHAQGGYAESGRVVAALVEQARTKGIILHPDQTASALITENHQVKGIRTRSGDSLYAEHVVITAGAWTPLLLPELAAILTPTGHPVFHLKPANPELFTTPNFPVLTADVSHTGWYGFPYHPREQVVKIANHGIGQVLHAERDERVVTEDDAKQLRTFLAATLPALADAPIVATRRCLYVDTPDGDFWIDRHPQLTGLTVATGDSGHGFKFAPVLGGLIADAIEGKKNHWLPTFRWREFLEPTTKKEATRYRGEI